MFALDAADSLGTSQSQARLQIENQSSYLLQSVALVERTSRDAEQGGATPALRGVWIGELRPGESSAGDFSLPIAPTKDAAPFAPIARAEERRRRRRD